MLRIICSRSRRTEGGMVSSRSLCGVVSSLQLMIGNEITHTLRVDCACTFHRHVEYHVGLGLWLYSFHLERKVAEVETRVAHALSLVSCLVLIGHLAGFSTSYGWGNGFIPC